MDTGLFVALGLVLAAVPMILLVRWARRRSRGAVVAGALLSVFAPDPTLEAHIRLVEASQQQPAEEDEDGEPK